MVSSWTEPEWDDEQRDLMVALGLVERMTGPNGEWLPDATAEGADPNEYGTPYRYVPSEPLTNWAEKTKLDALDALRKARGENANLNGVYITVDRVDY